MQGVKQYSRRLGYGQAPMPEVDPDADEGTCPGCGHYGALQQHGYCGEDDCREAILDTQRRNSQETGHSIVQGKYYRIGDLEVVSLENAAPGYVQPDDSGMKHPDMCVYAECETFALPDDTLCPHHRREERLAKHYAQKRQREGQKRRRKGRGGFNRIRGL